MENHPPRQLPEGVPSECVAEDRQDTNMQATTDIHCQDASGCTKDINEAFKELGHIVTSHIPTSQPLTNLMVLEGAISLLRTQVRADSDITTDSSRKVTEARRRVQSSTKSDDGSATLLEEQMAEETDTCNRPQNEGEDSKADQTCQDESPSSATEVNQSQEPKSPTITMNINKAENAHVHNAEVMNIQYITNADRQLSFEEVVRERSASESLSVRNFKQTNKTINKPHAVKFQFTNDPDIQISDEGGNAVVVARLLWDGGRAADQAYIRDQKKRRLEEKCELLDRQLNHEKLLAEEDSERGRQAMERADSLQNERDELKRHGDTQLEAMTRTIQRESKREKENIVTFYIAMQNEIDGMALMPDERQLYEVAENLFLIEVRLLGLTNRGTVFMDCPAFQWSRLRECQKNVQSMLLALLPAQFQSKVLWQDMRPCSEDIDFRLGQQLPVSIANAIQEVQSTSDEQSRSSVGEQSRPAAFDPMKSTCRHDLTIVPETQSDQTWIRAIAVDTESNRIFMAIWEINKIMVASMHEPHIISEMVLDDVFPFNLALLRDKSLVVTLSRSNFIYRLDVKGDKPEIIKKITTAIPYEGVGECENDTLVVSSSKSSSRSATVDIITLEGTLVRTLVNSQTLTSLRSPCHLCVRGDEVVLSDMDSHCLFCVDLKSCRAPETLTHPQLESPRHVSADRDGNLYIASHEGPCVLVMSVAGQWRQLLHGKQDGAGKSIFPWTLFVTNTHNLLVSWDVDWANSVIKGYSLT